MFRISARKGEYRQKAKLAGGVLLLLLHTFMLGGCARPVPAPEPVVPPPQIEEQVVTFPDPNLERVIRTAINRPTGPIRRSDLIGLTDLDARGENISDLAGIEHLTNLTYLNLDVTQISDITPLAGLTKLAGLELWGNQISDITPLAGLTNLTRLNLKGNPISDITPLAGLTNLTDLWLGWKQISDLAPLVANAGLGAGDRVSFQDISLDLTPGSKNMRDIEELRRRGVEVLIWRI